MGEAANPGPGQEFVAVDGSVLRTRQLGSPVQGQQRWIVTTLASPTVASMSIVHALERYLVATQWDPSANASVPTRDLESLSGTVEFSSGGRRFGVAQCGQGRCS